MTIAAGFMTLDGIILCADTQETIAGYTKNSTEKIRFWKDSGLNIAITGAGDTELIEAIGGRVEKALVSAYPSKGFWPSHKVREIIQAEMSESFRAFIAPYAAFPKEDRPWCDLLILTTVANGVSEYECLFRASGTIVREVEWHADCVGTGLILAKSLIERFYSPDLCLDEMFLVACYIMHQTKKWVDGCGGKTDMVISSKRRGFFWGMPNRGIEELERQFDVCEEPVNRLLTGLLNPNRGSQESKKSLSAAQVIGARSRDTLYNRDGQLLEILKKLAPYNPPRSMPSNARTSKGQK